MDSASHNRLRRLLDTPREEFDLAEAALLLTKEECPAADVAAYLTRLDALADAVRARLPADAPLKATLAALNHCLFREHGFAGNLDEYYDPRNSLLSEVLDRRLGIPITLSILYMEVGRRLGLPLEGVSFPGHFLVKLAIEDDVIVLDAFRGGASLDEADLARLLSQVAGEKEVVIPLGSLLATAGKRDILARMLRNLKAIYMGQAAWDKALSAVDRILLVMPGLADERRDRGLVYERLGCARPAIDDYERYLAARPNAPDAGAIQERLRALRDSLPLLH
jgi:regulator of sirC expression with transglutaminase-like and TPR domain